VVFGLLARLLRRLHPQVVYARNITDVDDKINAAAAAAGVPIDAITGRYAKAYFEDMARLGADPADLTPHATAHISQIIAMCERLISLGHAGSPGFDGFQSTKSIGPFLYGATSTRAPASISSSERFERRP